MQLCAYSSTTSTQNAITCKCIVHNLWPKILRYCVWLLQSRTCHLGLLCHHDDHRNHTEGNMTPDFAGVFKFQQSQQLRLQSLISSSGTQWQFSLTAECSSCCSKNMKLSSKQVQRKERMSVRYNSDVMHNPDRICCSQNSGLWAKMHFYAFKAPSVFKNIS